jgi:hypothetical protein
MAENPSLIVPIGQVPYESRITNHTEYLPARGRVDGGQELRLYALGSGGCYAGEFGPSPYEAGVSELIK